MTEEFKVLTDAEHLRLRVGMYAGSTAIEEVTGMFFGKQQSLFVIPALIKIICEILDNSIDEAIRTNFEYGNKISLSITKDDNPLSDDSWIVAVEDNGRGIPVERVNGIDQYRPVVAWTQARAGTNFTADRETIGANGVGSFLTNVLSTEFIGETSDGKHQLTLKSGRGNINAVSVKASTKKFTRVTFKPDLEFFSIDTITPDHISFIKDRLENLAVCYPKITFSFNSEKIRIRDIKEYAMRFCPEYVVAKDESNVLIFGPSGSTEEFYLHSYVNGLWTRNGGTHITYILDKIIDTLREHVKKKHKIDVLPNAIKQHLTLVTIVRGFKNLKFDSQTKERITNSVSEISSHFKDIDFDKIAKQILNTPAIVDPMIASILYKKEAEERRELEKKKKQASKKRVINHIEATSNNPDEKMLLLCEGLSAIGMTLNVRDPRRIGGYPLRGKVLNTRGMKPIEIIKNKEISELMSILNLEFGKEPVGLPYGKIGIMTDADHDGSAILCLLLNFFSLWPKLFSDGRICKVETPLYVCTKGKDSHWFYTQEEYASASLKGYDVSYFKGLGTLPKHIYKECINNPRLVTIKGELDILEMAFGSNVNARKDWMLNA